MLLGEFPIKKEGSQGQNKTYLVALKLAQFDFLKRTGRTVPLLLLDDIFDKLDASPCRANSEAGGWRQFRADIYNGHEPGDISTVFYIR